MPLFRYIDAPIGLEDATFLFDTNPDATRFAKVTDETPDPDPDPQPEPEAEPVAETSTDIDIPEADPTTEAAEDGDTEEKNA